MMNSVCSDNNLQNIASTKNTLKSGDQMNTSDNSDMSPNDRLFRTLMNDPKRRAVLLEFLSSFDRTCVTPVPASSQSLLQTNRLSLNTPASVSGTVVSSPLPLGGVLEGVVAYVDLRNKGGLDRSAGAKALLHSLGATVKDSFTQDVTHVIFKDGSFDTYLKAKQNKVHLLSVLWLEAVRKDNERVSEEDYPALGTAAYDVNITAMCEDYEEVVHEELRMAKVHRHSNTKNKTALPSELRSINSSNTFSSQVFDAESVISYDSGILPSKKAPKEVCSDRLSDSTPELTSDNDSDCGIIDGHSVKHSKNLDDIELNNKGTQECSNTVSSPSISLLATKFDRKALDDIDMELTSLEDKENAHKKIPKSKTVLNPRGTNAKQIITQEYSNTASSPSISLLSTKFGRKALDDIDMELTSLENIENTYKKTPKSKTVLNPSKKVTKGKNDNSQSIQCNKLPVEDKNKDSSSNTKLKSSSDGMLTRQYISDNNCPNTSRNSFKRNIRSSSMTSLQISNNNLNPHHLNGSIHVFTSKKKNSEGSLNNLNPKGKKRIHLDTNFNGVKKGKSDTHYISSKTYKNNTVNDFERNSNEKTLSLRVSGNHSREAAVNMVDVNVTAKLRGSDHFNMSFIDRLSRMATRGTSETGNRSNMSKIAEQYVSPLNRSGARTSMRSSTSLSSQNSDIQKQIDDIVSSLSSNEDENDDDDENEIAKSQKPNNHKVINILHQTIVKPKSQNNIQASKRNLRKLYNPNQTVDEVHKLWLDEENKKAFTNRKLVPLVPVAPILLTPKAKKFLKYLGGNKKINPANEDTEDKSQVKRAKTKKEKEKGKTKKTKLNKAPGLNENDEQTELTDEIIKGRRKSLRLSLQNKSQNNRQLNRRSTLDFVTPRTKTRNLFVQNQRKIKPSIVCTRLHKPDVTLFMQIVKKLGVFSVEEEVSKKTTHLVVGETKRTINLLRALARGCWILKLEWLLRSLEEGKWLPEEDYELIEFSPAVQNCRLQQQAFGRSFSMDIFDNCGPIYICRGSIPRRSDLEELVMLCKGSICNSPSKARIVVGEWVRYDVTCVTEQWILDSITSYKKKSFSKYFIR